MSSIPGEKLQAAGKVALSFISAFKFYSLYPKGHLYAQNHLHALLDDLKRFLKNRQSLRLDIEKYSFCYKGKPLFNGSADESNPVFLLTRDRILFLEFDRNIQLEEITTLFDIFIRHRNPREEVDGDIATSLWHIPFTNIHYETADIFAMETIDFQLSMFKPQPGKEESAAQPEMKNSGTGLQQSIQFGDHAGTDQHFAGFYGDENGEERCAPDGPDSSAPGLLLVAGEADLAELTEHEKMMLESYVRKEKERDLAADAIDILLIALSMESGQLEFAAILDLLEFEYFDALAQEEYQLANKICKNIDNISKAVASRKPWAVTLINMFFASLAGEERYHKLPMISTGDFFAPDPEDLKSLLSAFDNLPAESIFILADLAVRTSPDNLRQRNELLELIEKKGVTAPQLFLQLLQESDEQACLFLFPVIEAMDRAIAGRIYLDMTRLPFSSVRRIGLDGMLCCGLTPAPEDLVNLLGDEEEQIRQKIISFLESLGGKTAEETVIGYLQSDQVRHDDELHILQCYRILGNCMSDRSVKVLRGILLGSSIASVFSKVNLIHKKGAAYALFRCGRSDAREIVQKGATSVRPDVRHACLKILDHS
ncbi:MAG: hypothetical protein SCH71_05740 [Desulfobulbaceae bacterium]|nr:hypothetical protein [Desulfobulbaceae bacterium]